MRTRMSEKTGAAIRKLRLARGWSLAILSEKSGVPISTLSRVELGQNALNYDKLMRLCRALDVDLEGLVAREADTAAPVATGRRSITRAGQGRPVNLCGQDGRQAADDLLSKSLTPVILDVTAAEPNFVEQAGEAYLHVLDGEVALQSRLYAPLTLKCGDGVYFDASSGYALTAPNGPSRAILVLSGEVLLGD